MKILQIITSSKNWAGMEQYAFDLSEALIKEGHELFFVIADDGDAVYPRFKEIGKVYLLPLKSKFDFKSIKALRRIVEVEKPDIIHTHQPKNIFHAHFASRGMDIKIVHTLHFLISRSSPYLLYSWMFDRATDIVAVSDIVKERFYKCYPRISQGKVKRIYTSVLRGQGAAEPTAPSEKSGSEPLIIGYAGRLTPEKGIEVLLRAFAQVYQREIPVELYIAGKGDEIYEQKLKNLSKELGIEDRVKFLGFVQRIDCFMDQVTIGVVPSIVKEALGLIILEYIANGIALITTDNGAQPELITSGKNGILVESGNVKMLAESLITLIEDAPLREKIAEAGRAEFYTNHRFEDYISQYIALYQS